MQSKSDAQLLRDYAERGLEAAFAEIVHRHTNLVYSAALRLVNSPDSAPEIAQNVFVGLARGAQTLSAQLAAEASLAGWLCRSTRNQALKLARDDSRRHSRERQAMELLDPISETAPDWARLRPVLDEAMAELTESDYDALVLRFFNNQDLKEVGRALGVSDDTAQKRVARALDKLRENLTRRGVATTGAALSLAISTNAVSVAPAGLAATISTAAALAATTLATTVTATAVKTIAMTTLQKTVITATMAAAIGTGIYEARQVSRLRGENQSLQQQQAPLAEQIQQLQRDRDEAENRLVALTDEIAKVKGNTSELLRLRGLVARLRGETSQINDPSFQTALAWTAKKEKLQKIFAERPDERIPEMEFLTDNKWIALVKDLDLDSEAGIHFAMGFLRTSAKMDYAPVIQSALKKFIEANNGTLPSDVSQLNPLFDQPTGDAILQRYKILDKEAIRPAWMEGMVLVEKVAGDKWSEPLFAIGSTGTALAAPPESVHLAFPQELKPAMESYQAQNSRKVPLDFNELRPYLTTPDQQVVLEKLIQDLSVNGK